MITLRYILFGLFTLTFYGVGIYFNVERQRVLVLQSYAPDYSWTRDVEIGLRRVFGEKSFFALRWHYMDTKNHPETSFVNRAILKARDVIQLMEPDIIIAIDDDAQQAAKKYVNHPKTSIVFAGVNGSPSMYNYDAATNVTGILERLPLGGVKDTLRLLRPHQTRPIRVVHLSDNSAIVRLDDAYINAYDWGDSIDLMPSKLVETFDEWKKALRECNQTADYILISNYRKVYEDDAKTKLVPFKKIIEWTMAHARVPVIGVNSFVAEDGVHLAVSTSPYEQGVVAAEMALAILNGKKAPEIPFAQTKQFIISLRQNATEFLKLPVIYESFARYADTYYSDQPPPIEKGGRYAAP